MPQPRNERWIYTQREGESIEAYIDRLETDDVDTIERISSHSENNRTQNENSKT